MRTPLDVMAFTLEEALVLLEESGTRPRRVRILRAPGQKEATEGDIRVVRCTQAPAGLTLWVSLRREPRFGGQ